MLQLITVCCVRQTSNCEDRLGSYLRLILSLMSSSGLNKALNVITVSPHVLYLAEFKHEYQGTLKRAEKTHCKETPVWLGI